MAFESGESKEFKKYTGLNKVKVIAVNPNKAELNSLGINFKEEPLYVTKDNEGKPMVKVDFWVKQEESNIIAPVKYILRPEINKSEAKGKTQWIDKFGGTTWSPEKPLINGEYFDAPSAKAAYSGEEDLIKFLKAWLNVKKGGEATLATDKLVKGDFTEIKSFKSNNNIWVLFTVSQNKYQNILPSCVARGFLDFEKAKEQFVKFITKKASDGYPLKDAYSIDFKEYSEVVADAEPAKPNFPQSMDNDPLPF